MLNKKKLIIIAILGLFLLLLAIFSLYYFNQKNNNKIEIKIEENIFNNYSFEDRESFIEKQLIKKFNVKEDNISVFIGRESEKHISGLFFIENYKNKEYFNGSFFIYIDNKLNIVWADEGDINCEIIKQYSFPQEMAQSCF